MTMVSVTHNGLTLLTIKNSVLFLVVTLCLSLVEGENSPLVHTPLGDVTGYYMTSRGGRQISAFTALPYAVPPVGELRFEAAVPISPWRSFNATQQSPVCVQRNPYIRQKEILGQEDCLYLNIYTPTLNEVGESRLLPVMVFIHGGGWMCGSATTDMYGPEFILDRDVILVTINYRLGPLGFLSTQDANCPGNNGLKDQQEALRFIQKVIGAFGGDKKSVTLFGESAGGASVHYHMISTTSAGLFHKGISESGTALVPWAEASPGEATRNAARLADFMGCPKECSKRMIDCLRSKDSYDIIGTEFQFYAWDYEPMTPFKAVVEPDLPGAFLTKSARALPDVPAVPWINGLNKDEGCLKSVWITTNETRYQEFLTGFETIAPVTFYYEESPYKEIITKKIQDAYFRDTSDEAIKRNILQVYSDNYFNYPAVEATQHIFNYTKQPVFLYELAYRATNSFSQIFGDPEGNYGVCHADELMHLFPIHFLSKPFSAQDIFISETILSLWTNFAISGDPNKPVKVPLKWNAATSGSKMEYLRIDVESEMRMDLAASSRVWSSVPVWHNEPKERITDEL